MIHTSMQLKAKVRNVSNGSSDKAQMLIRNYIMERFLERMSISKYRDNFILKGGMLVSRLVGIEQRTTMDIDTTIKNLSIQKDKMTKFINEIISIELDDNVYFEIKEIYQIMEGFDYPGVRFLLEARLDNLKQVIKVDISTNDVITPTAVDYSYKLMFEERYIHLYTYNVETLLAEKLETILDRNVSNTRMRDYYDIYTLKNTVDIDLELLQEALNKTCIKRNSVDTLNNYQHIMEAISIDGGLQDNWDRYVKKSYYVNDLSWNDVTKSVSELIESALNETFS